MESQATLLAALLLGALSGAAQAQAQTFTVDDDGPADFSSLAEAVQLVPEGSVLLIEPGWYGDIDVDRRVTLLGRLGAPAPTLGTLHVTGPGFEAQHLTIVGEPPGTANEQALHGLPPALLLEEVSGPVYLDDLRVERQLEALDCAEVTVTRSYLRGSPAFDCGQTAVRLTTSRVQLVDCTIVGGRGRAHPPSGFSGIGGDGLSLECTDALVVGCDVLGGPGMSLPDSDGQGGRAISCGDGSFLDVRGASEHLIEGGPKDVGSADTFHIGILADPDGRVRYGGPTIHGLAGWHIHESIPPRPFLLLSGDGSPGSSLTLSFHGRRDSLGMVVFSSRPANELHPAIAFVPAYVDFDFVLSNQLVVLQGNESPVQMSWTVPDAPFMAGRTLYMQGFQGHLGGWLVGTNVEHFTFGHR